MHIRIENSGAVDVNILSLNGHIDFYDPYHFMVPDPTDPDGNSVSFPVALVAKNSLNFNLKVPIHPYILFTDAQVAARTRKLIVEKTLVATTISVEVIDPSGKFHRYQIDHKLSLVSLCNLFISYWKSISKEELVVLATGDPNSSD
jgi:hypothetical protein